MLGGDPTLSDTASIVPVLVTGAATDPVVFQFRRSDLADAAPDTTITVEYGSDLAGWATALHGVDGISISYEDDAVAQGMDLVTVSFPRSLEADVKFFERLKVAIAP